MALRAKVAAVEDAGMQDFVPDELPRDERDSKKKVKYESPQKSMLLAHGAGYGRVSCYDGS